MLSLHQLTCFLATYEHGSLTGAANALGYAQPSVSEQIRALEKTLGVQLFRRVGRGVVPTSVADTLRPHAEKVLASVEEARQAVASVRSFETGTIRFGMFGIARLYAGASLIADVLARYPGVNVELVGQNSIAVAEDLRRGRLEAAMLAVSSVNADGLTVTPVAREELVYISADPAHLATPVTAHRLSLASLVMPETTWAEVDSTRTTLRQMLTETGRNPRSKIEVEDIETAVEVVGMGLADSVIPHGAAEQLLPRLAPNAGWVSLRPRQFDTFAVVHRAGAVLSPAARLMIELATERIRSVAEPINRR
ncbi:LysR family transcriptional regulator [Nocardioides sp. GY 10127]|uniref:LysR family transcriptional regulator n=1 Tax=Nocardioides sp. GY 10127 TaxID=2569762 RepID=UPI0010A89F00|nr:LysR family transcriptional regulator [Nocardioides sp. GY 10127]TIC79259.1 LysR family transcriptional regulator [Nocardioides sp. GY 10127]